MTDFSTASRPSFATSSLLLMAALGLMAGVFVYYFARPVTPALFAQLVPFDRINAQNHALLSLPFAYQLPSFLHMFSMLLICITLTHATPRLKYVAYSITLLTGLMLEFVQHPDVSNILGACQSAECSGLAGLTSYAHHGTFDILDVVAIGIAGIVAIPIARCIRWLTKGHTQ